MLFGTSVSSKTRVNVVGKNKLCFEAFPSAASTFPSLAHQDLNGRVCASPVRRTQSGGGGSACQKQLVVYKKTPVQIKRRCPVDFLPPSGPSSRLINGAQLSTHSLVTCTTQIRRSDFTVQVLDRARFKIEGLGHVAALSCLNEHLLQACAF